MQLLHIIGEAIFGDSDEKTFGQRSHNVSVAIVQIEKYFGIVANSMAKVTHTKVQVIRERFVCSSFTKCSLALS